MKQCEQCKGKGKVIVCEPSDTKHKTCKYEQCVKCNGTGAISETSVSN